MVPVLTTPTLGDAPAAPAPAGARGPAARAHLLTVAIADATARHGTGPLVLHLCAGPGGWEVGMRHAGHTGPMVGVDVDADACATATAAGHVRVHADLATLNPADIDRPVDGLVGSPPCPTFSGAGRGAGLHLITALCDAATAMSRGEHVIAATRNRCARILAPVARDTYPRHTRAHRSAWVRRQARLSVLTLEPLRWALALRPRWIALEQVPGVLPIWEHLAALLRTHGYRSWAGIVHAEQYGVPQTRRRAILLARLDGPAAMPPPVTHQRYRRDGRYVDGDDLFGEPLPPPVSMAAALEWNPEGRYVRTGNQSTASRVTRDTVDYQRAIDRPAPTLTGNVSRWHVGGKCISGECTAGECPDPDCPPADPAPPIPDHPDYTDGERWAQSRDSGPGANRTPRPVDRPSYTIRAQGSGTAPAGVTWCRLRNGNRDRACVRDAHEPSATMHFGHMRHSVVWECESGTRRRVEVEEAAALQTFPPGYPWHGSAMVRYRQVGDAVPPLLAAHLTAQFLPAGPA